MQCERKREVAEHLRQEEAGGKMQPEEEYCSRMQRGEEKRETGCNTEY